MSHAVVMLFEDDQPLLAALEFALSLEGYLTANGAAKGANPAAAHCLVIDQDYRGHGLGYLQELRAIGITAHAILLATNPLRALRECAASLGVVVIEKPLLGDGLTEALRVLCHPCEAA